MNEYLAGMDIGTTNTKIVLFDLYGNQKFFTYFKTPLIKRKYLGEVLSFSELWRKIVKSFQDIPHDLKKRIRAIGISSLGETVFPIWKDEIICDGMIWYNPLTIDVMERYAKDLEKIGYFRKTGLNLSWIFSAFKMIYIYENLSLPNDIKWLDLSSLVAYKMTGRIAMDKCFASRTFLLNINTGKWDEELLSVFGIPICHLPEILSSGESRGKLKRSVAKELGLSEDVVISVAGQDHISSAIAAGVFKENRILNSTGTTEVVLWGIKRDKLDFFIKHGLPGYNAGFHSVAGFYYLLDSLPTGGYCIEWMLRKILKKNYEYLKRMRYKKNSVYFFPFLRGMFFNERIGAGFLNLKDLNDVDDLISSIFESLAFEVKLMMDKLKILGLKEDVDVIAVGGETFNDSLMKVRASTINKPIQIMKVKEATALGAALAAGVALKIYKNFDEAFESSFSVSKIIEPDMDQIDYLKEKYENYVKLRRIIERIAKIDMRKD